MQQIKIFIILYAPTSGSLQWKYHLTIRITHLVWSFVIFFLVYYVGGKPENTRNIVQRGRSQHTNEFLEAPFLYEIVLYNDYIFLEHNWNWFIIYHIFYAKRFNQISTLCSLLIIHLCFWPDLILCISWSNLLFLCFSLVENTVFFCHACYI